jgi:hypothetical protein
MSRRWSRRRCRPISAMIDVSPVRNDGPGRASRQRTLPIRRPDHQECSRPPIRGTLSGCTRVAAQAPTACGAPESTKKKQPRDDPIRDRDVRRSRKFHASAAPTRLFTGLGERRAAVLPDERMRELPAGRCRQRRRDLSGLRLHPAHPLNPHQTNIQYTGPPGYCQLLAGGVLGRLSGGNLAIRRSTRA